MFGNFSPEDLVLCDRLCETMSMSECGHHSGKGKELVESAENLFHHSGA